MLKHIVLFKLKDPSPESRRTAIQMLLDMRGKIEGLLDLQAGSDILGSERSCDVGLICTFSDRAALDAYQIHPVHLPVKAYMAQARVASYSCDFEI